MLMLPCSPASNVSNLVRLTLEHLRATEENKDDPSTFYLKLASPFFLSIPFVESKGHQMDEHTQKISPD